MGYNCAVPPFRLSMSQRSSSRWQMILPAAFHPVLLGAGIPLFPANAREAVLRFEGARTFPSGLVQLRYERTGRG